MDIVTCIIISALTAGITTKIIAAKYFEIVDGYARNLVELTKEVKEVMKEIASRQNKL